MSFSGKKSHQRRNSVSSEAAVKILLLLSFCGYIFIGYFLSRENFLQYISIYLLLFAAYIKLLKYSVKDIPDLKNLESIGTDSATLLLSRKYDLKIFIVAAILFRLSFLFSIPTLSDDYFRFIWDGKMWAGGENPFAIIPSFRLLFSDGQDDYLLKLYAGMNSPDYFTVYPPVCQLIFALAAKLFPGNILGSVVVIHASCIASEIGTIHLLQKILSRFSLPKRNVLLYALNPLVITELSGNLHFEAMVIFFLVLSVYWIIQFLHAVPRDTISSRGSFGEENHSRHRLRESFQKSEIPTKAKGMTSKFFLSGISLGFAVASKLVPLMFLPFLIKRLKWERSIGYFLIVGSTVMLLFLPFINKELIAQLSTSLDLYFRKFEFNAGIFYIIRWIGFEISGHDIIQRTGPWLAVFTFVLIMILVVKEKDISWKKFFLSMQWSLTIYLLLATTVHPWYITPLVMFAVVTGYQYPIVWSLFIALSYVTYQSKPYYENPWFIAVEYLMVIGVMFWEITRKLVKSKYMPGYISGLHI